MPNERQKHFKPYITLEKPADESPHGTSMYLLVEKTESRRALHRHSQAQALPVSASYRHLVSAWFQTGAAYVGLNDEYVSPNSIAYLPEGRLAAAHHRTLVRPGLGHTLVRHKFGTCLRILHSSRSTRRSLSSRGPLCREEDTRDGHQRGGVRRHKRGNWVLEQGRREQLVFQVRHPTDL